MAFPSGTPSRGRVSALVRSRSALLAEMSELMSCCCCLAGTEWNIRNAKRTNALQMMKTMAGTASSIAMPFLFPRSLEAKGEFTRYCFVVVFHAYP